MRRCFLPPKIALELESQLGHPVDWDDGFRVARRRNLGVAARTPAGIYSAAHEEVEPGRLLSAPYSDNVAAQEAADGLGATGELLRALAFPVPPGGDVATVNYGDGYDNAFYDGSQMVFGDGDGVLFVRFTRSLDVCGHELFHGVTGELLNYQGESGALNESLSDCGGAAVRQLRLGLPVSDPQSWLIGHDILGPDVNGVGLRDMLRPGMAYDDPQLGKDDQPDNYADYVHTRSDNGGVHTNSGIPNRAFALTAMGLGDTQQALKTWYRALHSLNNPDATFRQFAEATVAQASTPQQARMIQGNRVRFGVLSASEPVPTPGGDGGTGGASFPGSTVAVDQRIARAAARAGRSVTAWQNEHYSHYFRLPR